MRLFDGHPQCHAMPLELSELSWGEVADSLQGAESAWSVLHSERREAYFRKGWRQTRFEKNTNKRRYPFLLPPLLQRGIFQTCWETLDAPTPRAALDCYMTSYFNAWLDNQNLYGPGKKWVTAFTPRLIMNPKVVELFGSMYPDGRMISLVRDPRSWYASAREWSVEWKNIDHAIAVWHEAADAQFRARDLLGDRLHMLVFDDLVQKTEKTMRGLCRYLRIRFTPELLVPTFNGLPIKANSSFEVKQYSVIQEPSDRYRAVLSATEIRNIEASALDRYEQLVAMAREHAVNARAKRKEPNEVGAT
jgi:hypothetical protein